jgi:hypothetical protein
VFVSRRTPIRQRRSESVPASPWYLSTGFRCSWTWSPDSLVGLDLLALPCGCRHHISPRPPSTGAFGQHLGALPRRLLRGTCTRHSPRPFLGAPLPGSEQPLPPASRGVAGSSWWWWARLGPMGDDPSESPQNTPAQRAPAAWPWIAASEQPAVPGCREAVWARPSARGCSSPKLTQPLCRPERINGSCRASYS